MSFWEYVDLEVDLKVRKRIWGSYNWNIVIYKYNYVCENIGYYNFYVFGFSKCSMIGCWLLIVGVMIFKERFFLV